MFLCKCLQFYLSYFCFQCLIQPLPKTFSLFCGAVLGDNFLNSYSWLWALTYLLVVNILITIYTRSPAPPLKLAIGDEGTRPNGHARPGELVDDVQQFELEGLISDTDEESTPMRESHSFERHRGG